MSANFNTIKSWGLDGSFSAKTLTFRVWVDGDGMYHLTDHASDVRQVNPPIEDMRIVSAEMAFEKVSTCCEKVSFWMTESRDLTHAEDLVSTRTSLITTLMHLSTLPARTRTEALNALEESTQAHQTAGWMRVGENPAWEKSYLDLTGKLVDELTRTLENFPKAV